MKNSLETAALPQRKFFSYDLCKINTPQEVRHAMDQLFYEVGLTQIQTDGLKKYSQAGGTFAGMVSGAAPGGMLFGPIGALIGGFFGYLGGSAVGEITANSEYFNRVKSARESINKGDFLKAARLFEEITRDAADPNYRKSVDSFLRNLGGESFNLSGEILVATFQACTGVLYEAAGLADNSLTLYTSAYSLYPFNKEVLRRLVLLSGTTLSYQHAANILHQYLKTPDIPKENNWLIEIYEALSFYDPFNTDNLKMLANLYALNGDRNAAIDTLIYVLKVCPEDQTTTKILIKIRGNSTSFNMVEQKIDDILNQLAKIRDGINNFTNLVETLSGNMMVFRSELEQLEKKGELSEEDFHSLTDRLAKVIKDRIGTGEIKAVEDTKSNLYLHYPLFKDLSENSRDFLATGEYLFDLLSDKILFDYACVSIQYAKTLEVELNLWIRLLYSYAAVKGELPSLMDELRRRENLYNLYRVLKNLNGNLAKQHTISIGQFRYALMNVEHPIFRSFLGYLGNQQQIDLMIEFLNIVAKRYRNGAMHYNKLDLQLVQEFRSKLLFDADPPLWYLVKQRKLLEEYLYAL